eukprot:scaffold108452_cov34-Tisochrysis_lutea.AAC.4
MTHMRRCNLRTRHTPPPRRCSQKRSGRASTHAAPCRERATLLPWSDCCRADPDTIRDGPGRCRFEVD